MKPSPNLLPYGLGALGLLMLFGSKKGQNVVSTVATEAQQAAGQAATAVQQTATQAATVVEQAASDASAWIWKVISTVSAHEGTYDSVNLNTDGAGLSFGKMQWAQHSGDLGVLLRKMNRTDPDLFAQIFGRTNTAQLLTVTKGGSLEPVAGVLLWHEPWVTRFRNAGRQPVFQKVQDDLALTGDHMQAAKDCARILNLATERSMTMFYDTSNQQGAGGSRWLAKKTQKRLAGKVVPAKELLRIFAGICVEHFRSPTDPGHYWYNDEKTLYWKQVGNEWHVHRRSIDLVVDITRRRTAILNNPKLSDRPLNIA